MDKFVHPPTTTTMPPTVKATIHKYPIASEITLPIAATFLNAIMTPDGPCAWFLVDPTGEPETRRFAVVATGMALPSQIEDCPYLATIQWIAPTGNEHAPWKQKIAHLFEIPEGVKLPPPPSGTPDAADWWKK